MEYAALAYAGLACLYVLAARVVVCRQQLEVPVEPATGV
jgi:hypothetical protein